MLTNELITVNRIYIAVHAKNWDHAIKLCNQLISATFETSAYQDAVALRGMVLQMKNG